MPPRHPTPPPPNLDKAQRERQLKRLYNLAGELPATTPNSVLHLWQNSKADGAAPGSSPSGCGRTPTVGWEGCQRQVPTITLTGPLASRCTSCSYFSATSDTQPRERPNTRPTKSWKDWQGNEVHGNEGPRQQRCMVAKAPCNEGP